ncbi:MAG: molybdopterin cofactor-binding domain-containing protein [Planctomycetota bacterium]|nr:molybdopterin cofactor-binding domain-containing protein [Planctomycetota bacterium]
MADEKQRQSINTVHGPEPPHGDFHRVGERARKIDSMSTATGQAVYTDDIALPGMLHAKTLRSPHPHAKILSIDTSEALALEGVHAVITGEDTPIRYGVIPWTPDENALAVGKVRFVGDEVAAVAAVDEDTANRALGLIKVDYELLDPYLDPHKSLEQGEPLIHETDAKGRPYAKGNVSKHVLLDFGDVDEAMEASTHVVEDDYFFHGTAHAPIEPHCAVAALDGKGALTLWSSTQIPHYVHRALAKVLELPAWRIRVIQPYLGGAFGGKSDPFSLEFCVALLAMRTGRPVKMLYTREETFYTHRGRHPMEMHFRSGCDGDGKLTAVDSQILIDGGAYSSFGLVTTYYAGQLLTGPTHFPAYRFDSTRVFTNKPPCGPKRGHGSVQPRFALEIQLDRLATSVGLDPIAFRRLNFQGADTITVNGQRVTSNGFLECLDAVEGASDWTSKRGQLPSGQGIGCAGSMYISGTNYAVYPNDMPQAGIMVKLDRSGLATVYTGTSDIGQGSNSVMATIVAEELGLRLEQIRVVAADTDLTPVDMGAYSSRITFMAGNAAIDAGRKLRLKVQEVAGEALDISAQQVILADGFAFDREDGEHRLPVEEAIRLAEAKFETLAETGSYNTPELGGDYRGGTIGSSPAYSFTAHVAQVDVDFETGEIFVPKLWIAHDCGRAISPVQVEGQIEGSTYMGVAELQMEVHDVYESETVPEAGLHQRPSLLEYTIPTSVDTPEFEALIVESVDPEGPYGAKEAGEGPLHGSLPAIANAVYDACGLWLTKLPFTPSRVLASLREAGIGPDGEAL